MIPSDNADPFHFPSSRNSFSGGNPVAIKVYRELLELCDFLLIPASAEEHSQAAPAIFTRLENSIEALGEHGSDSIRNTIQSLEQTVTQSMDVDGLSMDLKTNIIMARELIERELHSEEVSSSFTFEDSLQQIEHLCIIIRKNGPQAEGQKHFDDAIALLERIDTYRKDKDSTIVGDIVELVKALESAPPPNVPVARTGRPASQFKKIWSELMRKGIDVMHPKKAHAAICDWLRKNGEPEDKLPTLEQIEKQYKSWIK